MENQARAEEVHPRAPREVLAPQAMMDIGLDHHPPIMGIGILVPQAHLLVASLENQLVDLAARVPREVVVLAAVLIMEDGDKVGQDPQAHLLVVNLESQGGHPNLESQGHPNLERDRKEVRLVMTMANG